MRGATRLAALLHGVVQVSIHAPHAGRDFFPSCSPYLRQSFNPRAPCGARQDKAQLCCCKTRFNPRAPCGARHEVFHRHNPEALFQSTRPVWGATTSPMPVSRRVRVSIHAPRMGRDTYAPPIDHSCQVSIHAPRVGRDNMQRFGGEIAFKFQSTRPVWGATITRDYFVDVSAFQSTRPVWGATAVVGLTVETRMFQSTRPVWGATQYLCRCVDI